MKTRKIPITEERKALLICLGLLAEEVDKWRRKWQRLIYHAERRELTCSLSFDQYVGLAANAGIKSASEIGKSMVSFQMSRYGDTGNYTIDNCRFVMRPQNIEEWKENGGRDAMAEKRKLMSKETHPHIKLQSEKVSKFFEVVSPEGLTYTGLNLSDFCKEYNLNRGNMANVCRGTMKAYKGWTGKYI